MVRAVLGRWSLARLLAWNAGVLLAWLGLASEQLPITLLGVAAFSLAALTSVALLAVALIGARRPAGLSAPPGPRA